MPPTASLSDPAGSSALVGAVAWVQGTLLGTIASAVAVIAVAAVGFMMLTGRIDLRRGVTVVIGCFILFGAPTIAGALRGSAGGGDAVAPYRPQSPSPPSPRPAPPVSPPTSAYDPYAGAALPDG